MCSKDRHLPESTTLRMREIQPTPLSEPHLIFCVDPQSPKLHCFRHSWPLHEPRTMKPIKMAAFLARTALEEKFTLQFEARGRLNRTGLPYVLAPFEQSRGKFSLIQPMHLPRVKPFSPNCPSSIGIQISTTRTLALNDVTVPITSPPFPETRTRAWRL